MTKQLDDIFSMFQGMGGLCARFTILAIIVDLLKQKDYEGIELIAEELYKMDFNEKLNEYTQLTGEVMIP